MRPVTEAQKVLCINPAKKTFNTHKEIEHERINHQCKSCTCNSSNRNSISRGTSVDHIGSQLILLLRKPAFLEGLLPEIG